MSTTAPSIEGPALVPEDFRADLSAPLPAWLEPVGALVDFGDSPSFSRLACQLDPASEVRPGQLLGVWHGRRNRSLLTVMQVSECVERNPSEEPDLANARKRLGLGSNYAQEGVSTRIYRLATCETLEEFNIVDRDGVPEVAAAVAPETLCRAGDPVVLLPERLAQFALGGLDDPNAGIHLGSVFGGQAVPVTLKPDIAQMHIGVFGNPGKGKSYLSGVLVEELHAFHVPTLILDINGETIDAARSLGGTCITLPDASRFGLPLSLLSAHELTEIAPNVQQGTQYAELIELAHENLRGQHRRSGHQFSIDELVAEIERVGPTVELKAPSIKTAVNRVGALRSNALIGTSFDYIGELRDKKLIVLDCRYLTLPQTRLIAAAAARTLQKFGRDMAQQAAKDGDKASDEAKNWFAALYIDEAHSVAPAAETVVSTQVLYELARMGRHVRTGLILASQSPADLDRSILKRLQTRFVFALERDQLQAIGGIAADLGDKILASISKLPQGVCAVTGTGELVRHGFIMKVRTRRTPVGGSTPKVFAGRTKGSSR